jgi:hypothetical protein
MMFCNARPEILVEMDQTAQLRSVSMEKVPCHVPLFLKNLEDVCSDRGHRTIAALLKGRLQIAKPAPHKHKPSAVTKAE